MGEIWDMLCQLTNAVRLHLENLVMPLYIESKQNLSNDFKEI